MAEQNKMDAADSAADKAAGPNPLASNQPPPPPPKPPNPPPKAAPPQPTAPLAAAHQAAAAARQAEAGAADRAADEPTQPPPGGSAMVPRSGGRRQQAQAQPEPRHAMEPAALAAAIVAAQAEIDARRQSQTPTEGMDETHPGGVYVVEGRTVNAHGEPIRHPDEDEDA